MLLSMTGFGEASRQQGKVAVSVEVRTINSRYFKPYVRISEGYSSLESRVESIVRKRVRRGTIQVNIRVERTASAEQFRINAAVLEGYRQQLEAIGRQWNLPGPVALESLLGLPGVVTDNAPAADHTADDWPVVREALLAALDGLDRMRREEGQAMAADLAANCRAMAANLEAIRQRAPKVVEAYRARLEERLNKILSELAVTADPGDVLREVGLFADRADISEEITRLKSHIDQFEATMQLPESTGRKLEFLTQEMVREVNTIGSKASDIEIARHVVEVKAALERIREMIQNIE